MRAAAALLALSLGLPAAAAEPSPSRVPEPHRRGEEQTYLTVPEWFLVFSPREYAGYVERAPPSGFPLLRHVGQFWQSYAAVSRATRGAYPVNSEYHVMVMVIGVSTTLEYGLRQGYETLVGRLFEIADGHHSDEDRIAARAAADYAAFLDGRAWFEFDFLTRLGEVWSAPLFGRDPLRKWERRYALTTEYAAKALYGALLARATRASFEAPKLVTLAVVRPLPERAASEVAGVELLERFDDGAALVSLPRYRRFTPAALELARRGAAFEEIAGNRGRILLSVTAPAGWRALPAGGRELLRQPILTAHDRERVLLELGVAELAPALLALERRPLELEHVFDY